ncbi:unnamed protein product [Mytilus edulis]|uniref:Uncharacterized protein n=1 Tax=Mytilus edulis TaxID=6550 RepID=A0A8S3S439_MYTED|nr:unnamed protein product [Mytilus edulis]
MGLNLPGSRAPASYCGLTLPASASNAMSWSRPPWSQGYPYSGFSGQGFHGQGFPGQGFPNQVFPSQPFPGFWPYCGPTPVIVPQSTTPNLSVSVPAALPTSSVGHQSNQIMTLEVTWKTVMRRNVFQLPQAAKKKGLLRMKMTTQIVSQPSVPVSLSSSVIGQSSTNSGKEPETEDALPP